MISVVMSTYNEKKTDLDDSIDSILNQDYDDLEFIIVNDNPNSHDLNTYLNNKCKIDRRIRIVNNKANLGQAESRNRGIEKAKGELIAIMDADDIADSNKLSKQLKFMKDNDLDFVYSNFKEIDDKGLIVNSHKWNLETTVDNALLKYIFLNCSDISLQSTWLLKKRVFNDLNGYRNLIVEDFDFSLRSILNNDKQGYMKECLVYKRSRSKGIMQSNRLKIYLTVRLLKKYVKKNHKIPSLNFINSHIKSEYDEKNAKHFDQFIMSFKDFTSDKNVKKFFAFLKKFFSCKFSSSYIFDSLLLRINQRLHNVK